MIDACLSWQGRNKREKPLDSCLNVWSERRNRSKWMEMSLPAPELGEATERDLVFAYFFQCVKNRSMHWQMFFCPREKRSADFELQITFPSDVRIPRRLKTDEEDFHALIKPWKAMTLRKCKTFIRSLRFVWSSKENWEISFRIRFCCSKTFQSSRSFHSDRMIDVFIDREKKCSFFSDFSNRTSSWKIFLHCLCDLKMIDPIWFLQIASS